MKFNKRIFALVLICVCFLMTGCGEKMIPLTEQESDAIALYSAKMVAKFNKNQEIGICNANISNEELGIVSSEIVPNPPAEIPVEETISEDETVENQPVTDTTEQVKPTTGYTLTEAFDIDGLDFWMSGLEVTDVYAASDYYVMTANKGMKYCIVTFEVKNITGSDIYVDMLSTKNAYTLTLNGSYKSTSQTTVLSNDLTTYQGTIKGGATEKLIMVFQFKSSEVENDIVNIDFVVQSNGVAKGTSL